MAAKPMLFRLYMFSAACCRQCVPFMWTGRDTSVYFVPSGKNKIKQSESMRDERASASLCCDGGVDGTIITDADACGDTGWYDSSNRYLHPPTLCASTQQIETEGKSHKHSSFHFLFHDPYIIGDGTRVYTRAILRCLCRGVAPGSTSCKKSRRSRFLVVCSVRAGGSLKACSATTCIRFSHKNCNIMMLIHNLSELGLWEESRLYSGQATGKGV